MRLAGSARPLIPHAGVEVLAPGSGLRWLIPRGCQRGCTSANVLLRWKLWSARAALKLFVLDMDGNTNAPGYRGGKILLHRMDEKVAVP